MPKQSMVAALCMGTALLVAGGSAGAQASGTASGGEVPPADVVPYPVLMQPPPPHGSNFSSGYHNGVFYVGDREGNFRLHFHGRAQIDSYNYFGEGVADTSLKSTIFLRRVRPEVSGQFLRHWYFRIGGDWGWGSIDTPTDSVQGGTVASGVQSHAARAAAKDVYLGVTACKALNFQVGQFNAPFTLENRTSDNYIPFMERSLAVRALGVPTLREIGLMAWGELGKRLLFYSVGVFNGDGENRPNPDNRMDVFGRAFLHPFSGVKGLEQAQIGGSVHYGMRDKNYVTYDYPGMSTQGAFTFWAPRYEGEKGLTHIIPSGAQHGYAGELRLPVWRLDFTGEFVYVNNGTREAVDGFQASHTERYGALKGWSYYAQVGLWAYGSRDVLGPPGYDNPVRVNPNMPERPMGRAVQLLVKFEQLRVKYQGASRAGDADGQNIDGDIRVNALSLGANYWATRHVRLTGNYIMYHMPDSSPGVGTPNQRALSPANTLPAGVNDSARNAHVHHELLFRAGVAF